MYYDEYMYKDEYVYTRVSYFILKLEQSSEIKIKNSKANDKWLPLKKS